MRLIDAIYRRKSVRRYLDSEIEEDIMDRIREKINEIVPIYPETEVCIAMTDFCRKTRFSPYYVGIYTDKSKEGEINAGYILQQLSIYLTAIGVASCYQSKTGVFRRTNSRGLHFTIALGFGYTDIKPYRNKSEIIRLKEKEVCCIKEKPNKDIEKLLEIARISPSSYNMQPWRFVVYNNRMHIFAKKRLIRKLQEYTYTNMGVMLGNIMSGADELWLDVKIKTVKEISENKYGDNEYIISVYSKDSNEKMI